MRVLPFLFFFLSLGYPARRRRVHFIHVFPEGFVKFRSEYLGA